MSLLDKYVQSPEPPLNDWVDEIKGNPTPEGAPVPCGGTSC